MKEVAWHSQDRPRACGVRIGAPKPIKPTATATKSREHQKNIAMGGDKHTNMWTDIATY